MVKSLLLRVSHRTKQAGTLYPGVAVNVQEATRLVFSTRESIAINACTTGYYVPWQTYDSSFSEYTSSVFKACKADLTSFYYPLYKGGPSWRPTATQVEEDLLDAAEEQLLGNSTPYLEVQDNSTAFVHLLVSLTSTCAHPLCQRSSQHAHTTCTNAAASMHTPLAPA